MMPTARYIRCWKAVAWSGISTMHLANLPESAFTHSHLREREIGLHGSNGTFSSKNLDSSTCRTKHWNTVDYDRNTKANNG